MADLNLGPVVDATVSKVIAVASEQLRLAVGWKEDLKKFLLIMKMLGGLLQVADENRITTLPRFRDWLWELQVVADKAEDVFEAVAYGNLRRQVAVQNSNWRKVSYFFTPSPHHPLVFRLRMANKVKNMNAYLADICDWATRMGLQSSFANTTVLKPLDLDLESQQTPSFFPMPVFETVGIEKNVSIVVGLLMDSSSSVVTIVSSRGLGKTTLAKAVVQNDKIQQSFGKNIIWVCVAEKLDVKRVLVEILESITGSVCEETRTTEKILESLHGQKFLLVLDDVRNEDPAKWEHLRSCLSGISKAEGSRVLVTTRSQKFAQLVSLTRSHIYHLERLDENQCWTIIRQRAFGSSTLPEELEEIGREIARKCMGLQLVAHVIGGVLGNVKEKKEWSSIRDMKIWGSLEKENGIIPILKFSFDRLPKLALKQCFAFCSIFPKDFVMEKEILIQLWMAQGYLQPSEGSLMEMEEIGDKYFEDLLSYSLFQEEKRELGGRISACRMHSLVHDLARFVSKHEIAIWSTQFSRDSSANVRHLNIDLDEEVEASSLEFAALKLHTLFSKQGLPFGVQLNLKKLRVLNFSDASDVEEFTCFGNSKRLRYLDISGARIKKFPKLITKLYNLQTFRFMNCSCLIMPPQGLLNLISLRHIYFNDEERMPANLGRLSKLQTLPLFFVGTAKGRKIEELGSLRRLTGKLEICKLELVEGISEAKKARLHDKVLDKLVLRWSVPRAESNPDTDRDVLEGLQPNSNVKALHIEGFGGTCLPSCWVDKFHFLNLVELQILGCGKLKQIPKMERFPSLQHLSVENCHELTEGAFAFPSLKELSIRNCPKMKTFSNEGLPSIQKLTILGCEMVSIEGEPLSTCLETLNLGGCYNILSFLPDLYGFYLLQNLTLHHIIELERLPRGLSSCSALEVLSISDCSKLVSVPKDLQKLSSLRRLSIKNCKNLKHMPSEDAILSLSKLERLEIPDFPELEEKIQHEMNSRRQDTGHE